MTRSPFRQGSGRTLSRSRRRLIAFATAATWFTIFSWTPVAMAVPAAHGGGLPAVTMFGYAHGPSQHRGTAAGKAHYVPASATRAAPAVGTRGHRAPKPNLAPPAIGTPTLVHTGTARMAAGRDIAGHGAASPRARRPTRPGAGGVASPAVTSPDNATYSVASTFDTVPMADQAGRVAVTLTNTGTSTWTSDYALAALVFPASNTTGAGTPLTTGPAVPLSGSVAPGGTATVEAVTPPENPGSYTICFDGVNAAGTYFFAEGGAQHCGAYTIAQFAPVINEQEPLPGTDVDSQNPALTVSATVPGGFPATPTFSFAFEIMSGPNPVTATVLQSSGWVAGNASTWSPTTSLAWGSTDYWRATVSDAATPPAVTGSGITWTTPISFVVGNAQPGVSATLGSSYLASDGNPIMTSDLGGADYQGSGKTVDPKTGNVSQQVTDAGVATTGPELSIVRTYNSLDPRTSQAFGAGWSSMLDMSLVPDTDGSGALILTMADGQQIRFAKNAAGGYAAPQNLYAVVTAITGGGFSIIDQTGTTYTFTQASGTSWLLSKITDNTGKAETLTYSAGVLTTITSTASGRALHLTWATPAGATSPHVATVATDPVTAGQPGTALTWTYGYSADLLTSVCPPGTTTACTAYTYNTSDSHAATSVRNADPTSYFRLNDAAGATTAANQIPVDDLTTMDPPATEFNTTAGVPGPISGVTATSFNGTSSWIPLDGEWCTSNLASSCTEIDDTGRLVANTNMAFSVWFKTTSASGVLLGAGDEVPAGSCTGDIQCDRIPLLWIGTNGHLEGAKAITFSSSAGGTYTTAAMSSTTAVNNGAWHQAVLIPGQALYLDGTKVASGTTIATVQDTEYAFLLGAGENPGSQCTNCAMSAAAWQYFNGSMADLSIYQNQLPSPGTVAAQFAAETHPAAVLTSITSPAGRNELSATYDTVNDRVATLTDANGGTWTYGGAVRSMSSGAYDSAVLGSAPTDFWPLNDSSGPLAHDVVGNAATAAAARPPATFSNVTLGAAGPSGFADGTAASFNGTSSQITVPGGYFAGTGAETAEVWFKTTKNGTLLSSGSGPTGGEPLTLWVPKGGACVEGSVGKTTLSNAGLDGICISSQPNDGTWHQAVLTLSPGVTTSSGGFAQTATLYQDGAELAAAQITTRATASATGYVADLGSGSNGFLSGSIADVSLYSSQLSSAQVTSHFSALHDQVVSSEGLFNPLAGVAMPTLNTQEITVTDPVGKNALYLYDSAGSLVESSDFRGGTSFFGYDEAQRASTITDPDGNTTYVTYDAHNNVTSTTSCLTVGNCQTGYTSYFENLSNPLDPRNDQPTDSRDARSTSPVDPTYDTVTAYTPTAQIASKTTPPTPACPAGCTTSYTYTAGTEAAVGGGTEPVGLLASTRAPGGGVTTIAYDSAGDVMQTTSPLGMVVKYTYDNLGRQLTQTQISDTFPNGLTTSDTYDGQDRILTETDPPITDRVTGLVHAAVTTRTYDADGNILTSTVSDAIGGDPSRTTTDIYNSHGELATTSDGLGRATSYTYDPLGDRITDTNPAGVTTAFTYDASGNLLTTTLDGYTGNPSSPIAPENLVEESRAYDPAGQLASVTNVMGTQTDYTYFGNGQQASSYVAAPGSPGGKADVTTYSYDGASNLTAETKPGGLVITAAYNADGQITSQTQDPSGADLTMTARYDRDGNVISDSRTGSGTTQTQTMTYNLADEELSQTTGAAGSGGLTITFVRDDRGLVISQTDPDGNVTSIQNDEAGRPVVQTDPPILSLRGDGSAPIMASPVTMTGYDTFGDEVEDSDANGNVTTATFDAAGQQISVTNPSYTAPGSQAPIDGTSTSAYNNLGEQTKTTDPLGHVTTMSYDQLGDLTSKTDPGGGIWTYTYDPAGEQTSVTDPTGAETQATYDSFGELLTSTDLVRQNASAAYTTTYGYNDAGDEVSQTSPTGVQTKAGYDALGQQISTTDGAGNTASYGYNLDGDLAKTILPDGSSMVTGYDQADRPVTQSYLNPAGTVLRSEAVAYNGDGDVTSETDARGNSTTATYNAIGLMTSQTQPVSATKSITVSFGYDLDGDETALTGGNGNTTYTYYNSLGLPQQVAEPPTAAHSSVTDSTTTDSYDGNGDLVTQVQPGGVQVSDTYDANGDLTGQSGSGASAPTATRTFGYDADGRILTAATAAAGTAGSFGYQAPTSESFSYDDRGLLLAAAGSAGSSSFTYNGSGQETSVTDAAGTSSYTYDSAGRLATDSDAASGATGTYSYDSLDQVTQISYGAGNDTRSFGYDGLHRLTSDTVSTGSGAQVAAIGYGYDADDDITSMTTTGLATPSGAGTVTNSYGYDEAGRLTSWTAAPAAGAPTTTAYGYDNDGNLVSAGGVTYTYDARDEQISDGHGNSYSYTANGDLATQTSSSGAEVSSSSDAYGQQITDNSASSFGWDAMDRMTSAASSGGGPAVALTYDGDTDEVASDPSATYSRDPAGQITGVDALSGGPTIALDDQHDDLSGTFAAAGTALASSSTYDPWGAVLASSGPSVQVGYQGQWTDPVTQQVEMGSRMYRTSGGFADQDTKPSESGIAVTDDLHAYADDNPVTVTDPSGHAPSGKGSSSGPSAADVAAANARAAAASAKAASAEAAYNVARAAAATAQAAAHGAAALARTLNSVAARLVAAAAATARAAAAAFKAAQAELKVVESWQDKANQAWSEAAQDLAKATHEPWWEPWKAVADVFDAGKAAGRAIADEGHAAVALADYLMLEGKALALQALAVIQRGAANLAQLAAKGAASTARVLAGVATAAEGAAAALGAIAARDKAAAVAAIAAAASVSAAYAKELARKAAAVIKTVAKKVAKVAAAVGGAVASAAAAVGGAIASATVAVGSAIATAATAVGSAIGAAATVAGGSLATAAAAAAGGNIGGAAAAVITGVILSAGSDFRGADYYTGGGQVCLVLCLGLSMTISRSGQGYISPSFGYGLGVSGGVQSGFIDNPAPQYHTPGYVKSFLNHWSSVRSAGIGTFSVTQVHGDRGSNASQAFSTESGFGKSPPSLSFSASMSQTWSYSFNLGHFGGRINNSNPTYMCARLSVCG